MTVTAHDILTQARRAERRAGDGSEIGGTGFTVLRHPGKAPLDRLVDHGRIGEEELRAAREIIRVFMARAGALLVRPASMERVDGGGNHGDPPGMIAASCRYGAWAKYWSYRARRGDPTMEIVIAALIDERPFRVIEGDLRLRNGRAVTATVNGLRDYAARSWWVDRVTAWRWTVEACGLFRLRPPRSRPSRCP